MPSPKVFLVISVSFFCAFVYFSYLVAKKTYTQFDFDTTVRLQDHLSRRWDLPFSVLSLLGSVEVTTLIWLGLVIFSFLKRYWLTIVTLPLFFLSIAVEVFGKFFVFHPGPPFLFYRGVINFGFPSEYVHTSYSYPSGHLTRTTFLASFLFIFASSRLSSPLRMILQIGLVVFVVSMLISRVYLGEHWSSDVIGGFLLGGAAGVFSGTTLPVKKKPQRIVDSN